MNMNFAQRLNLIMEGAIPTIEDSRYPFSGITTMYKAFSPDGLKKFDKVKIPRYIGNLPLAMIYAEPLLTGPRDNIRTLISVSVDLSCVRDLSEYISDICLFEVWQKEHPELVNDTWTAFGSAHGNRFGVYWGKPVDDYKIVAVFHNQDEWEMANKKM